MHGKRGLIMGVANDHSIAWGIAKTLAAHGASLAFTYQGDALGKRVKPLAESLGSKLVMPSATSSRTNRNDRCRTEDLIHPSWIRIATKPFLLRL